jgi:hypothetical protein
MKHENPVLAAGFSIVIKLERAGISVLSTA